MKRGSDELTLSNAIGCFHLCHLGHIRDADENELTFGWSHFSEFARRDFDILSIDELSELLGHSSHSSHRLRDEDELCVFLISDLANDLSYFSLFELVRFEYLSIGSLEDFSTFVRDYFDCLDVSVGESICRRLCDPRQIDFGESGFSFRGLHRLPIHRWKAFFISSLSRQCNGNVHTKGIVTITSD
jgi:hypothetical protein